MLRRLAPVCLTVVALLAGCVSPPPKVVEARPPEPEPPSEILAEITTPRGVVVCELFFDKMPLTVTSFVGLAEGTLGPAPRKPFFDGLTFHRVVPGFVVQGGDPTGTGKGGPGYRFPDEFAAGLRHDGPGVLSMANSGPDTNGSQFFITLGEARYLDYVHNIFGRVVRGLDLLPQIQPNDTMTVKIVRRGPAAERFRADEQAFAALLAGASRASPPHLVDRFSATSTTEPWQAKYMEYRLGNLARFTGRRIYLRLFPRFEADPPGKTLAEHVAGLPAQLNLPADSLLVCYFGDDDQWHLAGAAPGVTLPELKPMPPPRVAPTTPDAMVRQKQTRIYNAATQIISSLIDQTDPK